MFKLRKKDGFGKWIPARVRLPEKSDLYLVQTSGSSLETLFYSAKHEKFNAFDELEPMNEIKCVAWMPLPEKFICTK